MWMLEVMDCFVLAEFAARQQIRVAAAANRPGLETDHAAQAKMTSADIPVGHTHEPVDAAELRVTAIASLLEVLQEHIPMSHQRPRASLTMNRVHGRLVGQPGRS